MLNIIHWSLLAVLLLVIVWASWKNKIADTKVIYVICGLWLAMCAVSVLEEKWTTAILAAFFCGYKFAYNRVMKHLGI